MIPQRCWGCLRVLPNGAPVTRMFDKEDPSKFRLFCCDAHADAAIPAMHQMRLAGNDPFDPCQLRWYPSTAPLRELAA